MYRMRHGVHSSSISSPRRAFRAAVRVRRPIDSQRPRLDTHIECDRESIIVMSIDPIPPGQDARSFRSVLRRFENVRDFVPRAS